MTASTGKKKEKRRRKNKLALFAAVFFGVLFTGSLGLALLAVSAPEEEIQQVKLEEAPQKNILAELVKEEGESKDLTEEAPKEEAGKYTALLQNPELMRQKNCYAREAASPEQIVMAFAGDILFDERYAVMARLKSRGGAIEEAFSKELLLEMRGADLFMVNNEFPYSNRGEPLAEKQFTFRAAPERVSCLEEMGVDLVSLANNHASDYGEVSLLDTLDVLEEAGMPYVGAGRNLDQASSPVSFILNDKKISILSATQIERNDHPDTKGAGVDSPGTFRCWNPDGLLEAIGAAKKDCDVLIVYIHWGTENQAEIDWAQRDQAVKIAQAGADLIVGDHPHCLQPVGYVEGVPVIYSMGNFWFNSKSLDTCLARIVIPVKGPLSVQILPARQEDCRTSLLEGTEKERVIAYLNSISDSAMLDEEGMLIKKQSP